jgi:hypothetical protein
MEALEKLGLLRRLQKGIAGREKRERKGKSDKER